jgi:ubiquinone/menaquinone biosynthesis C-methylase UbiE
MQKGRLITGRQARLYDYRGPLWGRIKSTHVGLVNPTPKQRVLDVGCGTGKSLWLLHQKCDASVKLFGIEPSRDMLRQAQARLAGRAELRQGSAQKLPYATHSFDVIISTQVLHHLPLAEKKKAVAEMRRVLKPGGRLIISDWGTPEGMLGKGISLLWRKHAYVPENAAVMRAAFLRDMGFTRVHDAIQFGVLHHITASTP